MNEKLPDDHKCVHGREHSWSAWVPYDSYVFEMGMSGGFRYRRECSIHGCDAKQRVENLEPTGKTEVYSYIGVKR